MNPPSRPSSPASSSPGGFTLVELMVSVAVIGLIMVVLLGMTNQISTTWRATTGKIEQFQQARAGFESMSRKLSQATLNTFWDMTFGPPVLGISRPLGFRRNSELRFVSGPMNSAGGFGGLAPSPQSGHNYLTHGVFFQAPFGYVSDPGVQDMGGLLNTWGFFVDFFDDASTNPPFLASMAHSYPSQQGYRLMEFQQPTENMNVYNWDPLRHDAGSFGVPPNQLGWFQDSLIAKLGTPPTRVLAENVIALIIWPKLSKEDEDYRRSQGWSTVSPQYMYDSSATVPGMYTNPSLSVYLNAGASVGSFTNLYEAGGINPKNQLPPILQVTMVALDAASAHRLVDAAGHSLVPPNSFTTGLFTNATGSGGQMPAPGTPTQYDTDLAALENLLRHPNLVDPRLGVGPLSYRIFTTNVMIRGAKWSSFQTQ